MLVLTKIKHLKKLNIEPEADNTLVLEWFRSTETCDKAFVFLYTQTIFFELGTLTILSHYCRDKKSYKKWTHDKNWTRDKKCTWKFQISFFYSRSLFVHRFLVGLRLLFWQLILLCQRFFLLNGSVYVPCSIYFRANNTTVTRAFLVQNIYCIKSFQMKF